MVAATLVRSESASMSICAEKIPDEGEPSASIGRKSAAKQKIVHSSIGIATFHA